MDPLPFHRHRVFRFKAALRGKRSANPEGGAAGLAACEEVPTAPGRAESRYGAPEQAIDAC